MVEEKQEGEEEVNIGANLDGSIDLSGKETGAVLGGTNERQIAPLGVAAELPVDDVFHVQSARPLVGQHHLGESSRASPTLASC